MELNVIFLKYCVEWFVANSKAQSGDLINSDILNISMCHLASYHIVLLLD